MIGRELTDKYMIDKLVIQDRWYIGRYTIDKCILSR